MPEEHGVGGPIPSFGTNLYLTKLASIFKIADISHARSARWPETKSDARRKPRHRLALLDNPKRKNTPCISDFARATQKFF